MTCGVANGEGVEAHFTATAVNELFIIYLCDFCERADESEDIAEKILPRHF